MRIIKIILIFCILLITNQVNVNEFESDVQYSNSAILIINFHNSNIYQQMLNLLYTITLLAKNSVKKANIIIFANYKDYLNKNSELIKNSEIKPNFITVFESLNITYIETSEFQTQKEFLESLNSNKSILKSNVFLYYNGFGSENFIAISKRVNLFQDELEELLNNLLGHKIIKQVNFLLDSTNSFNDIKLPKNTQMLDVYDINYALRHCDSEKLERFVCINYKLENQLTKSLTDMAKIKIQNDQLNSTKILKYNTDNKALEFFNYVFKNIFQFLRKIFNFFNQEEDSNQNIEIIKKNFKNVIKELFTNYINYELENNNKQISTDTDKLFVKFIQKFKLYSNIIDYKIENANLKCLKSSVEIYNSKCDAFNAYSIKYVTLLYAACERNIYLRDIAEFFNENCN